MPAILRMVMLLVPGITQF